MIAEKAGIILHIGNYNGITSHYFSFLEEKFDLSNHVFACLGIDSTSHQRLPAWGWLVRGPGGWMRLLKSMMSADKVIIHGLFSHRLVLLLCFMPGVLLRCYWVMWGGDFMQALDDTRKGIPNFCKRRMRVFLIRRMGHLLTYIPGDLELVRKRMKAKGKHWECIMYPSNVFAQVNDFEDQSAPGREVITVLVGNSADSSNEHDEIFERIKSLEFANYNLVCPLSYGDAVNASRVEELGKSLFGSKFTALNEFIGKDEYLHLLGKIDIAVFAHRRQQGMGNMINLIGCGKKVYLRQCTSAWSLFEKAGVRVYPIDELNFEVLDSQISASNSRRIEQQFSVKVLAHQWSAIFTN